MLQISWKQLRLEAQQAPGADFRQATSLDKYGQRRLCLFVVISIPLSEGESHLACFTLGNNTPHISLNWRCQEAAGAAALCPQIGRVLVAGAGLGWRMWLKSDREDHNQDYAPRGSPKTNKPRMVGLGEPLAAWSSAVTVMAAKALQITSGGSLAQGGQNPL